MQKLLISIALVGLTIFVLAGTKLCDARGTFDESSIVQSQADHEALVDGEFEAHVQATSRSVQETINALALALEAQKRDALVGARKKIAMPPFEPIPFSERETHERADDDEADSDGSDDDDGAADADDEADNEGVVENVSDDDDDDKTADDELEENDNALDDDLPDDEVAADDDDVGDENPREAIEESSALEHSDDEVLEDAALREGKNP